MDEPLATNSEPTANPPPAQGVLPLPVIQPKFCHTCGRPWQPEWTDCPYCQNAVPFRIETPEHERRSIRSALLLYFVLLGCSAIAVIAISSGVEPIRAELGGEIGMAAVVVIWAAVQWRRILPLLTHVPSIKWFGLALIGVILTLGVAQGFVGLFNSLVHARSIHMQDPFLQAGYGWGVVMLAIAVQPALIEELAFRGIIFSSLQEVLGPVETIFVSAMMFMVLHLSPGMFPHTLAIGLAAGFLRWRTKSLYPAILLHFLHNSLVLALG